MFVAFKLRKYTEKYYQLQKEQERNNSTLLPRAGEEGAIVNDCEKRYKNVQNGETFIQLRLSVRHAHCSSHIIDRRHGEQTAAAISNQLVFSTRNRPHNCKQLSCCWRSAGDRAEKKTNVLATTARLSVGSTLSAVCGFSDFRFVVTPRSIKRSADRFVSPRRFKSKSPPRVSRFS